MKKVTFITLSLILASSISIHASNKKTTDNSKKLVKVVSLSKFEKNDDEVKHISYLTKYQYRKSTSRKSRMDTVQNFLKNPERKHKTFNALC